MDKEEIKKYIRELKARKVQGDTIIKIKKHEAPFVQIDKKIINDTRLSWKAKGLLVYLLSKPSDWQIYLSDLIKRSTDRRTATSTGLDELECCNYLYKERLRNEKGQFVGWLFWAFEQPNENPNFGKPKKPKGKKT